MQIEVVEPFPVSAIPRVWTWMQEFRRKVADDFSPQTLNEFVETCERDGARTWGVYRDGELGGIVAFEKWRPTTGTAYCVFKKSFWGPKTAHPALCQVFRTIFDSGIHKLVFLIYEDHCTVASLLKEVGARREGLIHEATQREGKFTDVAIWGLTKEGLKDELSGQSIRKQAEDHEHVEPDIRHDGDVQPGDERVQLDSGVNDHEDAHESGGEPGAVEVAGDPRGEPVLQRAH